MKRTVDTWFLIELSTPHPRAQRIFRRVEKGRDELLVPTITLAELHRLCSRKGTLPVMKALLAKLDQTPRATLVPCDRETALKAGELSSAYGLSTVDAVVAATALLTKSHALLSRDSDFKQLRKQKLLRFESW